MNRAEELLDIIYEQEENTPNKKKSKWKKAAAYGAHLAAKHGLTHLPKAPGRDQGPDRAYSQEDIQKSLRKFQQRVSKLPHRGRSINIHPVAH